MSGIPVTQQYWHDKINLSNNKSYNTNHIINKHIINLTKRTIKDIQIDRHQVSQEISGCTSKTKTSLSYLIHNPHAIDIMSYVVKESRRKHITFEELLSNTDSFYSKELRSIAKGEYDDIPSDIDVLNVQLNNKLSTVIGTRTWKDIPVDELRDRLNKGEIIGNDKQWIPGISQGRKTLGSKEYVDYVEFAKEIKIAGSKSVDCKNWEDALTKYTQGVRLLEWVTGQNEEECRVLEQTILMFHKNRSLAALNTGRWNECRESAALALDIDQHDSKARYRRARAAMYIGDTKAAKNDYMIIIKSPFTDSVSKAAAVKGLRDLLQVVNKWKSDMIHLVNNVTHHETFGSGRSKSDTTNQARDITVCLSSETQCHTERSLINDVVETSSPILSRDQTFQLLEELLSLYTSKEVRDELNVITRLADFDERRFLIRLRKFLPGLLESVFKKFNFTNPSYTENKKAMDNIVYFWSRSDEIIKSLSKTIYTTIFGDIIDC